MVKKKEKQFLIVLILIIFIILVNNRQIDYQAFVGIGTVYEVQSEEYNVFIETQDKYWLKTGCKPAGCAGKNACSVTANVIGYELGCQIEECICEGYYYCQSSYQDRCQYSAVCEYPDTCYFSSGAWRGTCCADRGDCQWISNYDCGTYGGPEYDNFDNCAWAVRIEDKNGTVVQRFDAFELNGPDWSKDQYYRQEINYVNGSFSVRKVSDSYGVVQVDGSGNSYSSCKSVVFEVQDSQKVYDVCIGNDGLDTVHCEDLGYQNVVTETCKGESFTCPDGSIVSRQPPDCSFAACPATCIDGIQNQNEEGIDCGGPCPACSQEETCADGIQNQDETDIDCGGVCSPCPVEETCADGIQNQDETGIDCGGVCQACGVDPTCSDGIMNQNEVGVDCGGPCSACDCSVIGCQTGYLCENNQCVVDTQQDTDTQDNDTNAICDTVPEVCDLFSGEYKYYAIAFTALIMFLLLTRKNKK